MYHKATHSGLELHWSDHVINCCGVIGIGKPSSNIYMGAYWLSRAWTSLIRDQINLGVTMALVKYLIIALLKKINREVMGSFRFVFVKSVESTRDDPAILFAKLVIILTAYPYIQ